MITPIEQIELQPTSARADSIESLKEEHAVQTAEFHVDARKKSGKKPTVYKEPTQRVEYKCKILNQDTVPVKQALAISLEGVCCVIDRDLKLHGESASYTGLRLRDSFTKALA